MKATAIVYTSNTGYTGKYARLLGEETGLPVYELGSAGTAPDPGADILYLGWLMAGRIQGYRKAAGRWHVRAVCGVGMGACGSQLEELRRGNALPEELPLFTLQGGFDRTKLRGVYRLMMSLMAKTLGKRMAAKSDRTAEEDDMLELLLRGGDRVSRENLAPVLAWYREG